MVFTSPAASDLIRATSARAPATLSRVERLERAVCSSSPTAPSVAISAGVRSVTAGVSSQSARFDKPDQPVAPRQRRPALMRDPRGLLAQFPDENARARIVVEQTLAHAPILDRLRNLPRRAGRKRADFIDGGKLRARHQQVELAGERVQIGTAGSINADFRQHDALALHARPGCVECHRHAVSTRQHARDLAERVVGRG